MHCSAVTLERLDWAHWAVQQSARHRAHSHYHTMPWRTCAVQREWKLASTQAHHSACHLARPLLVDTAAGGRRAQERDVFRVMPKRRRPLLSSAPQGATNAAASVQSAEGVEDTASASATSLASASSTTSPPPTCSLHPRPRCRLLLLLRPRGLGSPRSCCCRLSASSPATTSFFVSAPSVATITLWCRKSPSSHRSGQQLSRPLIAALLPVSASGSTIRSCTSVFGWTTY